MVNFRNLHAAVTTTILLSLFTGSSYAASITRALQTYPDLSKFLEVLTRDKAFQDLLNTQTPKTLFAPSNAAMAAANMAQLPLTDQQALMRYHVLNGSYPTAKLEIPGGTTLPTYLEGDQFALLGGQTNKVFASSHGNGGQENKTPSPQIFTGLGEASPVQPKNITYDGGIIHIIDRVFTLPENCTSTAKKDNWMSLLVAMTVTNLTNFLDTTPRITCFAPSDEAFRKAGSPEKTLSAENLTKALQYHTLQGDYIGYTDTWKDGLELTTLSGDTVTVTRQQGAWWVNGVQVLQANVITSNGVAHLLAGVLSPGQKLATDTNGTTTPNTTTSSSPSGTESAGVANGKNGGASQLVLGLTALVAYFAL